MGFEGGCQSSPGLGVQDGGLNLKVMSSVKNLSKLIDEGLSFEEEVFQVWITYEVQISLLESHICVLKSLCMRVVHHRHVDFTFSQKINIWCLDWELSCFCSVGISHNFDDVPSVQTFNKGLKILFESFLVEFDL